MKIDSLELKQVAAAAAPRLDLYSGIHKALRSMLAQTLMAMGRMDVHDKESLDATAAQVTGLLAFCASHLQHENAFVHAAMEARAPGASGTAALAHDEHQAHIARLAALVAALPGLPAGARPAAAHALYHELGLFAADNLQHMHLEETAHNAVLWAHYTDAELAAIHDSLVASIPPDEMLTTVRWMLPAMNPAERLGMLLDMRSKAPPPAFQAVLESARQHLDTRGWDQLARGLGMAPELGGPPD